MQAVQGGLLGGHKSTSVKHNIYYSPQPAAPHLNWSSAWQLAGPLYENRQPLTTQSVQWTVSQPVQHHKLPPQREIHVCYRPGQAKWRIGSNVCVWNIFENELVGEGNMFSIFYTVNILYRWEQGENHSWALSISNLAASLHRHPARGGFSQLVNGKITEWRFLFR